MMHDRVSETQNTRARTAIEIAIWTRAIKVFFDARWHPASDDDASHELIRRSWTHEIRIISRTLLHVAHLAKLLTASASDDDTDDNSFREPLADKFAAAPQIDEESFNEEGLAGLSSHLNDAASVAENLTAAPQVSSKTWFGFGRLVCRAFDESTEVDALEDFAARQTLERPPARLRDIAARLAPPELAEDARFIFVKFYDLLDLLRFIEPLLRRDHPLKQTLPLWTLIHIEALNVVDFINLRAMKIAGLPPETVDILDAISYATGMELRKVFAHELLGLSSSNQAPVVFMKIENAHGLLRDSFQQSIVTLAQAFDETLAATELFRTLNTRLEQSLELRRDVWTLLRDVREIEKSRDASHFAALLEAMNNFRASSMRHLMYKDWEAFERFVDEATAARGATELIPVLHRFGTYLETLFGQINMRAALAAHPFEEPRVDENVLSL